MGNSFGLVAVPLAGIISNQKSSKNLNDRLVKILFFVCCELFSRSGWFAVT